MGFFGISALTLATRFYTLFDILLHSSPSTSYLKLS